MTPQTDVNNNKTAVSENALLNNEMGHSDGAVVHLENFSEPAVADYYKAHPYHKNRVLDLDGISQNLRHEITELVSYIFSIYGAERNISLDQLHSQYSSKLIRLLPWIKAHPECESLKMLVEKYASGENFGIKNLSPLFSSMLAFLKYKGDRPKPTFSDDKWPIDEMFSIAPERRANGERRTYFNFSRIKNDESKTIIKGYIRFLINRTSLSVDADIYTHLRHITEFANYLGDVSVTMATRQNLLEYMAFIANSKVSKSYKSNKIFFVHRFYKYLLQTEMIQKMPITVADCPKQEDSKHKNRAVKDSVFIQFMRHLDDLSDMVLSIFMIICCTGIRIGDVLALKRDSVRVVDGKCSVFFYMSKMRREYKLPLSGETRKKVLDYIEKTKDSPSDFLFPSPKNNNYHVSERYFSDKMKDYVEKWNICLSNGKIYNFQAHDFRHRMATEINRHGLNVFYVQKALGHTSIIMSQRYIDNVDERVKSYATFLDRNGIPAPLVSIPPVTDSASLKEWLVTHANAKMVQDGICDRSARFGKCECSVETSCLECEYYRTSPAYLPYHEQRLEVLKEFRAIAEENGSDLSVTAIDREIEIRKKFIDHLHRLFKEE